MDSGWSNISSGRLAELMNGQQNIGRKCYPGPNMFSLVLIDPPPRYQSLVVRLIP